MHACMHMYIHTHTCMHAYRQTDRHTDRQTDTYTHTYTHTYVRHFQFFDHPTFWVNDLEVSKGESRRDPWDERGRMIIYWIWVVSLKSQTHPYALTQDPVVPASRCRCEFFFAVQDAECTPLCAGSDALRVAIAMRGGRGKPRRGQ